jgi:hypothetical protein
MECHNLDRLDGWGDYDVVERSAVLKCPHSNLIQPFPEVYIHQL